jgi:hypothetical protein
VGDPPDSKLSARRAAGQRRERAVLLIAARAGLGEQAAQVRVLRVQPGDVALEGVGLPRRPAGPADQRLAG